MFMGAQSYSSNTVAISLCEIMLHAYSYQKSIQRAILEISLCYVYRNIAKLMSQEVIKMCASKNKDNIYMH